MTGKRVLVVDVTNTARGPMFAAFLKHYLTALDKFGHDVEVVDNAGTINIPGNAPAHILAIRCILSRSLITNINHRRRRHISDLVKWYPMSRQLFPNFRYGIVASFRA